MGDDVIDFLGRTNFPLGFAGDAEGMFFEEPRPCLCPLVVVERLVVLLSAIVVPFAGLNDLPSVKHGKGGFKNLHS